MASGTAAAMKMTRMKSFVKKWQNLAKVGKVHTYSSYMDDEDQEEDMNYSNDDENRGSAPVTHPNSKGAVPEGCTVVFVGKARRRYAVHSRHLQHPLFKELQQRSETCGINQSQGPTLGCEVVLFEHLLWMLDSDDPALYTDSIQELAELYMPSDGSSLLHLLNQD